MFCCPISCYNFLVVFQAIENEVQEAQVQSAEEIGKEEAKIEAEIAENEGNPNLISPATTREGTAAKAFQRVKAEEWINKRAAKDNSYKGTFGSSGWGAKAQEVLGKVSYNSGIFQTYHIDFKAQSHCHLVLSNISGLYTDSLFKEKSEPFFRSIFLSHFCVESVPGSKSCK